MDIEDIKKVNKAIKDLEKSIGLSEGFFSNLLKSSNDWEFIIKLHSFLEAICTALIIKALGRDELENVVGRMEMSGTYNSKIVFISELSLLNKGARNFIRKLSEIRNFYAHNIKNISLSLEEYLKKFDKNQLNNFIKTIGYDAYEKIQIGDITVDRGQFIKENPRVAIHLGTFSVLAEIVAQLEIEKFKFEKEILYQKHLEEIATLSEKLVRKLKVNTEK